MAFYKYNEDFSVEKIRHNSLDEHRVRWWEYRVISKLSEEKVKEFCVNTLVPIHSENFKNNPFSPEIVEFRNTTNNNDLNMGDMFIYIVKKETTA